MVAFFRIYLIDSLKKRDSAHFFLIECEYFEYDLSVGMADYPTDYYYSIVKTQSNVAALYTNTNQTMNDTIYKSTTCLVNIFYSDLGYNAIVESPSLTFDQVVGLVG